MRHHRFYTTHNLALEQIVITDPDLVHQLFAVLKLQPGEEAALFDGSGKEVLGVIVGIEKKQVVIDVRKTFENKLPADLQVTLYCAMLKRDNFEWVVQKATEVGVHRIVPIITKHTVKTGFNNMRLQKISIEASEQSGRSFLPTLEEPMVFSSAIEDSKKKHTRTVLCDFSNEVFSGSRPDASIGIFIGPEGGWDSNERMLAVEQGCSVLSLGTTVLRAETAAVVATYLAVNF
jgi:16S rRNA (uracil1498-N3)-methyltransferase